MNKSKKSAGMREIPQGSVYVGFADVIAPRN